MEQGRRTCEAEEQGGHAELAVNFYVDHLCKACVLTAK